MPPTGSARSAPKPLTISNLLHSQHRSDDQPKDAVNEPLLGGLFVKTRLAYFVFVNGHPLKKARPTYTLPPLAYRRGRVPK